MVKLIVESPFIDFNGEVRENLVRRYAVDEETGEKYMIKQVQTGIVYDEAIDLVTAPYTYEVTDEKVEKEEEKEDEADV